MTVEQFRQLALSLPGTEETAHFERAAFKITGRRIFATLHETSQTINLPLTPADQASFTIERYLSVIDHGLATRLLHTGLI